MNSQSQQQNQPGQEEGVSVPQEAGGVPVGSEVRETIPMSEAQEGLVISQLREQLAREQGNYQRVLADFANYQRRALANEQQAKTEAMGRVASDVAMVIDTFDMATNVDPEKATAASLIDGMRMIRGELVKVLGRNGVTLITPQRNDEFVPGRHEAVMQQAAEGVEPGRIVLSYQPGYMLTVGQSERVLRPAKVVVAPA
jgi:molecular chaperone GrpE